MASAAAKRHWTRVAALGCLVCGGPAEIAHAHGPSLTARGFLKPKGKKQAWQDYLVLPLCPAHHRHQTMSLDNALATWESIYGTCAMHIDHVGAELGVDPWALARAVMRPSLAVGERQQSGIATTRA
jgi:hypothetical protein